MTKFQERSAIIDYLKQNFVKESWLQFKIKPEYKFSNQNFNYYSSSILLWKINKNQYDHSSNTYFCTLLETILPLQPRLL